MSSKRDLHINFKIRLSSLFTHIVTWNKDQNVWNLHYISNFLCKFMFSTTLLNFRWSKNWNVKIQQVSHLHWILGKITSEKQYGTFSRYTLLYLTIFTYFYLYFKQSKDIHISQMGKLMRLKFNQKMIWISRIEKNNHKRLCAASMKINVMFCQ